MAIRFRFTLRRMMLGIAALGVLLATGLSLWRWYRTPTSVPCYVRPLEVEPIAHDTFLALGAEIHGFEFSLPKDRKAIVTLVVKQKGKLVREVSRVFEIEGRDRRERFCVFRIKPDALREQDTGRERWVTTLSGQAITAWIDGPDEASVSGHRQTAVPTIVAPKLGKDYRVWFYRTSSRSPGNRPMGEADRPLQIEIRFRVVPIRSSGNYAMATSFYREEDAPTVEAGVAADLRLQPGFGEARPIETFMKNR